MGRGSDRHACDPLISCYIIVPWGRITLHPSWGT